MLVAEVGRRVRLDYPRKDGTRNRDHYEQIARSGGDRSQDLQPITIPDAARYLLDWFFELNAGRQSNGFGAEPLSYSEVRAWSDLTETRPLPWEIRALKTMDSAFLTACEEQQKRNA